MIRAYMSGDAGKVLVQDAQGDETADGVAGFETIEAYTLTGAAGEVLAVLGYRGTAGGICEVYALLGQNSGQRMVELVRFMDRKLARVMREKHFVRARATVKSGFAAGRRLMRILGFSCLGVLPQFYNGNDYLLFERIEKWRLLSPQRQRQDLPTDLRTA